MPAACMHPWRTLPHHAQRVACRPCAVAMPSQPNSKPRRPHNKGRRPHRLDRGCRDADLGFTTVNPYASDAEFLADREWLGLDKWDR